MKESRKWRWWGKLSLRVWREVKNDLWGEDTREGVCINVFFFYFYISIKIDVLATVRNNSGLKFLLYFLGRRLATTN